MTPAELTDLLHRLRSARTDTLSVEAKAASWQLPAELWRTLSAFANSPGGGVVLLGVDERANFAVTGLVDPKKAQEAVSSLCDQMEPPLRPLAELQELEGNPVLLIELAELAVVQKPCYLKAKGLTGGAYVRVGDSNRQLSQYEVQLMIASRGQPLEDVKPVTGSALTDLDDALVARLISERRGRGTGSFAERSGDDILRVLRVIVPDPMGGECISRGGLLALGRHPQQFFPQVRMTFVSHPTEQLGNESPSGERFLDNASFEGPISAMVDQALTRLRKNMRRGTIVRGALNEDQWEYPDKAVREAIVNALVHRDVSDAAMGAPVQIQMFPDRLEIQNPGGLFGPVSLEQLGENGVSSSRNSFLLRVLEDLHVCENRGSGIGVMVAAMRAAGLRPPEFDDQIAAFRVTFPNHTLMSEETSSWLSALPDSNLTETQRTGLALMRQVGSVTNATYRRATGTDSRVATRELADLVQRGLATANGVRRWTTYELTAGDNAASSEQLPLTAASTDARSVQVAVTSTPAPVDDYSIERRVLEAVRLHGPLTRREIEARSDLPDRGARGAIQRLMASGQLEPTSPPRSPNRRYRLPGQSTESTRTGR